MERGVGRLWLPPFVAVVLAACAALYAQLQQPFELVVAPSTESNKRNSEADMLTLKDGRVMVYGAMGGDGQPQTQAAVFTRVAVFGMDPQSAVAAPRWLLGRTWGQATDTLKLESRFEGGVLKALGEWGHDIEILQPYDDIVGHASCIVRHPNGVLEGGADPRSDGCVAAY